VTEEAHQLTPEQLEALSSEPRRRIVEVLAEGDALSIADIAARTGQPVTRLYRHIQQLLAVGLVVEAGQRPAKRRPEATYALRARRLSSAAAVGSPAGQRVFARTAARYAAGTARAMSQAVAEGRARLGTDRANLACAHLMLTLDRERLGLLQRAIADVLAKAQEWSTASDPSDTEAIELTLLLAPAPSRTTPKRSRNLRE
jgi:DNA-binding transcriptional ArsR family regulator